MAKSIYISIFRQEKDQLKDKIKKNLELLKYTTQMIIDEN